MKAEIYPGILTHTLEEYVVRLEMVESSDASWVHVDVADGQFVPNITVMPHEFMGISSRMKMEVHIMAFMPERYFSDLTVANVARVLLHREAYKTLEETAAALKHASDYFPEVGLVINPGTPIELYGELGLAALQCMGVHPGFSGQPLLDDVYGMLEEVTKQGLSIPLAVDGGVSGENIKQLQKAGASRFVMTSQLFATPEVSQNLHYFSNLVTGGI